MGEGGGGGGEFGGFGEKLELDVTLLDVNISVFPWESKLPGHMDEGAEPYYHQSAKRFVSTF